MPTIQFKGKSVIETYHHTVPHHRLEFVPKLSVLPKGGKPGLGGNLIIEGDNLAALKSLLPTHAGKVKCVYIDPPYNTGNECWVYNDNLTQPQFKEWIGRTVGKEGDDATRHDKWCCMMYPRLQLLKELLREDGSIWVSIDDNEIDHLRMMMDEIFGTDCFVAQITVLNNRKGRGLRGGFAQSHDYLLVYSKRPDGCEFKTPKSVAQIRDEYTLHDDSGVYRLLELRNTHREFGKHNRKNLFFPLFISTSDGSVSLEQRPRDKKIEPIWDDGFEGCWSWGQNKVRNNANELVGRRVNGNGNWKVYRKSRPTPLKPKTVWLKKGFLTEKGQPLLTEIFGSRVFHAPKPLDLMLEILRFSTNEGDIVLDSCAGSGTTAHAVLAINADAKTARHFVLVQQPYDTKEQQNKRVNICQTVTVERVRRVITGKWAIGKRPALDGTFSYATIGEPLFGEYRDFGKKLPTYEEVAKYVFYTETSREIDLKKINEKSGLIGSTDVAGGTSYYLLYTPNRTADREMSLTTLKQLLKKDKRKQWVIYCEKIWLHPEELRQFERENGKRIRPMLVPFGLK